MRKKFLILAILIGIISIMIVISKKKSNKIYNLNENTNNLRNVLIEENGYYIVTEDDGDSVIFNTITEAEWYMKHPNYNPEPVHYDGSAPRAYSQVA